MIATIETQSNKLALGVASAPSHGLRAECALDAKSIAAIRRKAALEGCKWDTQVGDVTTLAPFPLVMKRGVWGQLAAWAEQLADEAAKAEKEISERPELLRQLGFPRALQKAELLDRTDDWTMRSYLYPKGWI